MIEECLLKQPSVKYISRTNSITYFFKIVSILTNSYIVRAQKMLNFKLAQICRNVANNLFFNDIIDIYLTIYLLGWFRPVEDPSRNILNCLPNMNEGTTWLAELLIFQKSLYKFLLKMRSYIIWMFSFITFV